MLSVPEFYKDQVIFLTGATGFIGKVLIEKLLRCCPGVKTIYVLVRAKKGQPVQARVTEMIGNQAFDKLRRQEPQFGDKIVAISGDLLEPELGISSQDQAVLQENVTLVFHSAATIRFDEPLRVAIKMNILAVKKMIHLCKTFTKLQAFIHISTAYANCDREYIEEVIYPPAVDPQKLIDAAEWMDDAMLDKITPELIGDKPNTYTFTKQLAEHLLLTDGRGMNIAVVRPSIVGAAWKEPFPGWIDNVNGPSGLYIAAGKGLLKSMRGDADAVADIVPVDLPVNMIVNVGWYTGQVQPRDTLVYHCTSGTINPISWKEIEPVVMNYWKNKNPLENCFRRPKAVMMTNSVMHSYWVFMSHIVPAYLTDLAFRCVGKKPRMVKIYSKIHKVMGTLEYFTTRSWKWTHGNSEMLKKQLSDDDNMVFYMCPRNLDWTSYLEDFCGGAKKFILKEDHSGLPAARAHLIKLRNIRYVFNTVILVGLWRVLIARSQIARNLWYLFMGLVFKFVRNLRISSTIRK